MYKFIALLSVSVVTVATAEDGNVFLLDSVQVIGSQKQVFNLPGSGAYFGPDDLNTFKFKNVNQTLRQAPGVYVRDEDGYGLFPNISIRGVDTNRSSKVTLMEDGILTAPAPYSAPSAYYSPTSGRMYAIEILKGSSQIEYGPHTTGGVVNYVSTPIPYETQGFAEVYFGSDGTFGGHFWYGGKTETRAGTFGSLVEIHREEADGFRTILPSVNGSFNGSDKTGYEKTDYMIKLSYQANAERSNFFEFKFGASDFEANETYLGLNPRDLATNPYSRYAASAADEIITDHSRSYLRHIVEFDGQSRLSNTLYYNNFKRDWYKLDKVNGSNPAQVMLTNPGALTGEALGDFKIKSNDREYYLYGLESKYDHSFNAGEAFHKFTAGIRFHKDKIDRFQDANTFENVYAGDFGSPTKVTGPSSEGDREQESESIALFIHDRIEKGAFTFTPGIRWEKVDWNYFRRDKKDPAQTASGSYSVFAPGLGFEYKMGEKTKVFGGYHRGYSVPSPSSKRKGYDEEISDSFEFGYRSTTDNGFYLEAIGFYTLLNDLIVEDSIAGGPGDGNVGDVDTLGLELLLGGDLVPATDADYRIPFRLAFTYTNSEIASLAASENPESIFAVGQIGNQVPYVPELQFTFTTGIEFDQFRLYGVATWIDERFADSRNNSLQENADGDPDARFGLLDSFLTIDLSAYYQLREDIEVFITANNLFDETYVTSRIPHGPRAGAPTQYKGGLNFRF